jgi:hypothetical protein
VELIEVEAGLAGETFIDHIVLSAWQDELLIILRNLGNFHRKAVTKVMFQTVNGKKESDVALNKKDWREKTKTKTKTKKQ